MNTRTKIVSQEALIGLLNGTPAVLVIGTFDPLLAAHAERLADLSGPADAKIAVAVADAPDTLLSLDARKEMAAALSMVDFVLPHASGLETAYAWTAIHDDTALHNRWNVEFKEHVRRRSQPA